MDLDLDSALPLFSHLGVSLAIGLLVGVERGWQKRFVKDGQRVAGVRTYAILGLTGGICGILSLEFNSPLIFAITTFSLAISLTTAYVVSSLTLKEYGITSQIASLATFLLGAMSAIGHPSLAAACAVSTVFLLGLKAEIHEGLRQIQRSEVLAALQLLIISVIILPLLPNRPLEPWGIINPFEFWFLIVLVTLISFVGHFAIRLFGHSYGVMVSGALGGLASSTALTVSFAQKARRYPELTGMLAIGIVLAHAVSFPRMLLVVWLVSESLVAAILWPVIIITTVLTSTAIVMNRYIRQTQSSIITDRDLGKPFSWIGIFNFALLLLSITLISELARRFLGEQSIYPVAIIGSFVNSTAVALSISKLFNNHLLVESTSAIALIMSLLTTGFFKVFLSETLGNRRLAVIILIAAIISMVCGVTALLMLYK